MEAIFDASAIKVGIPKKKILYGKTGCRPSFGVLQSVIVLFGMVAVAVAVGVLLRNAWEEGNALLARDIQNVTSLNVVDKVLTISLVPRANLVTLAAELVVLEYPRSGFVSPSEEGLRKILFGHSLALLDGVFIGFPDGRMSGYIGDSSEQLFFVNTTQEQPNGTLFMTTYTIDAIGLPTSIVNQVTDFNAHNLDWYNASVRESRSLWPKARVTWTNTQLLDGCHCLGITCTRPVYIGPRLIAVVATHLRLDSISLALNTTRVGVTGTALIIDSSGYIVAVSDPNRFNFNFSALSHVSSFKDEVLRGIIASLLAQSGEGFAGLPSVEAQFVVVQGGTYILSTVKLAQSASDLNWTAVIYFPRDDYFSRPDQLAKNALIVASVIAVLLTAFTMCSSTILLAWPLHRLANSMDHIAETLDAPAVRRHSLIHEVATMQESYEHMAVGIRSFSKYVAKPVVMELINTLCEAEIQVMPRECTFFFSDIVDFTSISEVLAPSALNSLLSEYFSSMENILHDLQGLTTDYIGDSLFVFWNAPISTLRHAHLACEAALRQQAKLYELRANWKKRGLPELYIRIGINTGPCLVGNFGSRDHLKYTVMGDSVNVASRFEQLNKQYHTNIMIGEATWYLVRDEYVTRSLDLVVVKGKSEPTRIFELICRRSNADEYSLKLESYSHLMLDAFLARRFDVAGDFGRQILEIVPGDISVEGIIARCKVDPQLGLSASWTGARVLLDK